MVLIKIGLLIIAYLFGSIPMGFLLGKAKGIDLREHGSKNIGTTNAGRVLGKQYAVITYIFDMFKGAVFVFLFRFEVLPQEYCLYHPLLYGLAATLGHTFPIYLKFKGGKAVATSSGVVFGFTPWLLLVAFLVFFIVTAISRYVSLGSIVSATSIVIATYILTIVGTDPFIKGTYFWMYDWRYPFFITIIFIILILRHAENIYRLRHNTERTVDWGEKK